ncbi:MAG: flagellar biosynthetic protein FliR [Gaiellales bacterium]
MSPLDVFAGNELATFFLVLARVGGLFLLAPVFASQTVPVRLRLGIAVATSMVAMPAIEKRGVALDPVLFGPQILEQLVIGSALAFGVAAVFAAVEMAGSIVDLSIGFSLAQVINPTLNTSSTALAQVYSLVATMVFLATGAHEVMIAGVVRSFQAIPLDQSLQIGPMTALVEHQMAEVVPIALQIAAPVLGTLLLVDVGFAFLARLVPSLNPFAAQFSVKILAGLFAVSLSLPLTIAIVGVHLQDALSTSGFLPGIGP